MFLDYFGQHHSFQTFDDKGLNRSLIKQLHGSIKIHFNQLAELNSKGAGVYFTVNETNGVGRTTKHIESIRSVFIDLDGSPLPENFNIVSDVDMDILRDTYDCILFNDNSFGIESLLKGVKSYQYSRDGSFSDDRFMY